MQTVHIQVKLLLAQASHTGDLREHFKNMDPNGVPIHALPTELKTALPPGERIFAEF